MISDDFIPHPHPDLQHVLIRKCNAENVKSIDEKIYSLSSSSEWIVVNTINPISLETFLNDMCTPFGASAYLYIN